MLARAAALGKNRDEFERRRFLSIKAGREELPHERLDVRCSHSHLKSLPYDGAQQAGLLYFPDL